MSEPSKVSLMLFLHIFRARLVLAAVSLLKRHEFDEVGVEDASHGRCQNTAVLSCTIVRVKHM